MGVRAAYSVNIGVGNDLVNVAGAQVKASEECALQIVQDAVGQC